jgi:hypothetical protein
MIRIDFALLGPEPNPNFCMGIRIQEKEKKPEFTKKPDFQPFKKAFILM